MPQCLTLHSSSNLSNSSNHNCNRCNSNRFNSNKCAQFNSNSLNSNKHNRFSTHSLNSNRCAWCSSNKYKRRSSRNSSRYRRLNTRMSLHSKPINSSLFSRRYHSTNRCNDHRFNSNRSRHRLRCTNRPHKDKHSPILFLDRKCRFLNSCNDLSNHRCRLSSTHHALSNRK